MRDRMPVHKRLDRVLGGIGYRCCESLPQLVQVREVRQHHIVRNPKVDETRQLIHADASELVYLRGAGFWCAKKPAAFEVPLESVLRQVVQVLRREVRYIQPSCCGGRSNSPTEPLR